MKILFITTILALIALSTQALPKITVYVESLCPYCKQFETTSYLKYLNNPARNQMAESVELIPFGNAKELPESKEGDRKFTCQHGENECYGNKIENCAFAHSGFGESFLACFAGQLQQDIDLDLAAKNCTDKSDAILECAKSAEGGELLHLAGLKTGDHKYVPYVLVNGEHNDSYQDAIQNNLVKFLCKFSKLNIPECRMSAEEEIREFGVTENTFFSFDKFLEK